MANSKYTLADAFNAIDDPQERLTNLTNLSHALSPWERRHVRLQLGDRSGLAGFEDLPTDVVCHLVCYLKIEDVLAVTAVSTRCRTIWTEPSVATRLCLHFFPALQTPFTFSTFCEAGKRYVARRAGKCYTRMNMSLPFAPNDRPGGFVPQSLSEWDSDSRRVLRPDPVLHPVGEYPAGWLEMLKAQFGCYGGGNIVWFAIPDYFVVDNMYSLTRRVIRVPSGITPKWTASSSKELVVLNDPSKDKLLVYDIASNTSLHFCLPQALSSMIIRDRRIFLVLGLTEVCVLDHVGSRILTTYHFHVDKDLEQEYDYFEYPPDVTSTLIFPHPHVQDCFFAAIMADCVLSSEDGDSGDSPSSEFPPPSYLIVREFIGSLHVASYHNLWALFTDRLIDMDIDLSDESEALDDQGSFATGHWSVKGTDKEILDALRLPPLPKQYSRYVFQSSFNTITKEFCVQRHAVPKGNLAKRCGPPWNQQDFFPRVPRPGILRIRRFDADDADFSPTRAPRPETMGERTEFLSDWTMKSELVEDEYVKGACRTYHDGDFTVMFLKELHLVYVWSYVYIEEVAQAARRSSPGPEESVGPTELG